MSLARLFDHTARIWRPTSTRGSALREEVRTLTQVGGIVQVGVRRPSALIGNAGAGLAPIGERVIYLFPTVDIRARDVVELVTGPDAPGTFEVDGPPTTPRGHHIETRCRHCLGDLP